MPRQFAAIAQPVSVCHQWSITGTPSFCSAQLERLGVAALAREEQRAEAGQVVAADVLALRDPAGGSRGRRSGR